MMMKIMMKTMIMMIKMMIKTKTMMMMIMKMTTGMMRKTTMKKMRMKTRTMIFKSFLKINVRKQVKCLRYFDPGLFLLPRMNQAKPNPTDFFWLYPPQQTEKYHLHSFVFPTRNFFIPFDKLDF